MISRIMQGAFAASMVCMLAGCASVDQFGSRIYDANVNSQTALDQETLLNIVRAVRYQNPNFVAITQVTGGQTESVTTGFPTFTIGPHAAPTLITNSLATGVSGGYQSNPLVSSQFEEGILSPVTQRAAAQLLKANVREPVLYTIIQSITFEVNGRNVSFINDPSDDLDRQGSEAGDCKSKVEHWTVRTILNNDGSCRYSKFENFLNKLLEFGFTAELDPRLPPSAKPTAGRTADKKTTLKSDDSNASASDKASDSGTKASPDATPAKQSTGAFCFDPTMSTRFYDVPELKKRQCASKYGSKDIEVNFDGIHAYITAIDLRSLAQVYAYLGNIQRNKVIDRVGYYAKSGIKLIDSDGKFLNIQKKLELECSVSVIFERTPYCVPPEASNTLMIISILEQIRNISIQPSDLNSAFTVRLSNG